MSFRPNGVFLTRGRRYDGTCIGIRTVNRLERLVIPRIYRANNFSCYYDKVQSRVRICL